jgi:manganese/zinc/iron transport system permease protein
MSMLGDAISHAILPGLAIAFLITSSRAPLPMLVGAALAGILSVTLASALAAARRVREDAALGVSFSLFFAGGIVLITLFARSVDLDPGCVLYGLAELIPLDTRPITLLGMTAEVPRAFPWLLGALLLNLALVLIFFKELTLTTFDTSLAAALGFAPWAVHAGLLASTAATSVVSFEVLGSILVIAMLVGPGATAYLITDRLSRMLAWSCAFAALAATLGYALALALETNIAGMVATITGAQFALALLLAPRHGVLAKSYRRLNLAVRIASEDMLSTLYRAHERAAREPALDLAEASSLLEPAALDPSDRVVGSRLACWLARRTITTRGLVRTDPAGTLSLTPLGVDAARETIRAHRLWEAYLATNLGLPQDHLHAPSHRVEHFLTPEIQKRLETELPPEATRLDPHGQPIPRADRPR